MHLPVAVFGEEIDASLALRDGEGLPRSSCGEAIGDRLEFFGVVDERLHLFFAPHRPKAREHARDRRRELAGGRRIVHRRIQVSDVTRVKSNFIR